MHMLNGKTHRANRRRRGTAFRTAHVSKGPRKNNFPFRAPIHPGWLCCSSVEYRRVFALLAPCQPGASAPSILGTYCCAGPKAGSERIDVAFGWAVR